MGVLASIFTWWNGATIGTMLGLRGKRRVGEDYYGNLYYEGGVGVDGNPRRWVIPKGSNDASRVAPEWFSWLHHQVDDVPDLSMPAARPWQKEGMANMTGTPFAYRPGGALEKGGKRPQSAGDYEAWTPE
ncbi:MAG TPA: NADH:ubiquinone oxidoreductase subunit NDUFA12 [Sphingomonas sp.]|jgi:NADH:ubiquinone oxidoreductase subunit